MYNANIPVKFTTLEMVKANKERLEQQTGQKVSYDAIILAMLGAEIKFKVVGQGYRRGKRLEVSVREIDPVIHI